jgi:oligo-1,6-glucosidase
MTVGEASVTHIPANIAAYVLPENRELNMVFQFEVMDIDAGGLEDGVEAVAPLEHRQWTLLELKAVTEKWQRFMREEGYWNA